MSLTAAELKIVVNADTGAAERGLKGVGDKTKEAGDHVGGFLKTVAGFAGAQLVVNAAGAAFGYLKGNITDMISSGMEANQVAAQLAAGLKSTHDASGMTMASLDNLSTSIMNQTGIDDDSVKASESMLLTFTNIGKDVFPQATQAVADLATKMNNGAVPSATQMEQASIQLGKALGDPLKGYTALQRVGVTFSDQQKEQIKLMMKHGDVAGAQGVILKEMNKEFGGSADAAGKANGGMAILTASLDNMKQSVGQAVIPILNKLMTAVEPLVQQFGAWLPGALQKASDFINKNVMPVIQALGDWFVKNGAPALQKFGAFVMNTVIPAVKSFADWFQQHILPALEKFADFVIKNVVPTLEQLFTWVGIHVVPVVQQLALIFVNDVLPAVESVWTSIATNLIPAVENLWNKIAPVLIPVLQVLGWIFSHVVAPAVSVLIAAISGVINVIATVIGWIGTALGWLGQLGSFIGGQLSTAWTGLGSLVSGVWTGIQSGIKNAINGIIDLIDGMIRAINNIHITLPKIGGIGGGTIGFAIPLIPHLAEGGVIRRSGSALVGEAGPELVALPEGAQVYSAQQTRGMLRGGGGSGGPGGGGPVHIHVHVAGRHVAEAILPDLTHAVRVGTGMRSW